MSYQDHDTLNPDIKQQLQTSQQYNLQYQNQQFQQQTNQSEQTNKNTVSLPSYCQFIQFLGTGSYGICCKCWSTKHNCFVTVKSIKMTKDFAISSSTMKEIQILKKMRKQENIQDLLDVNYDKNAVYLILEFCDFDLPTFLKTQKIEVKTKIQISLQMVKSLQKLHEKGFLHRDIKPSNCLIKIENQNFHFKLSDFSLSINYSIQNDFSYKIGTLGYKAPELCCYKTTYGAEIDIFSVGCTLYEIFTGEMFLRVQNENEEIGRLLYIFGTESFNQKCFQCVLDQFQFFQSHLSIFDEINQIFGVKCFQGGLGDIIKICVQPDYTQRPTAKQLVEMFQDLYDRCQ